jgi:ELWxxDGT repeat protein
MKEVHAMKRHPSIRSLVAALTIVTATLMASTGSVSAATGPYLVKDINTSGSSRPAWLTAMGNTLFFVAKGGNKGRELWKSDGTSPRTVRVKDIRAGSAASDPEYLAVANGLLWFNADDGVHGRELWVSDGTTAGTRLVKDIWPGGNGSEPSLFTEFGGAVYFRADNGVTGQDLWLTDGTSNGTTLVKDIQRGSVHSFIFCCVPFAGKLFFTRHDDVANNDLLYKTNGTAAGTKPFRDRDGHLIEGNIGGLTVVGPRLFFGFNENLWRSDGTSTGTRKISDVQPRQIAGVGNTAFIDTYGQLWASDGTAATTRLVKDVVAMDLHNVNGTLFFLSDGNQPWTSDGMTSGTQAVPKQVTGEIDGVALGSVLYFGGYSDEEGGGRCAFTDSQFLWRSDGTADGTYDVDPSGNYCPHNLTAVGSSIYFTSDLAGNGSELWRYVP